MTPRRRAAALLAFLALAALPATPAAAATAPVADFHAGQTLGIGLAGASWDYGLGRLAVGGTIGTPAGFGTPSTSRIKAGTRAAWRFLDAEDIQVATLVGLEFDPGYVGGRSYLVPDLGLGVAYHFRWSGVPLAVRFNVTLTVDQGQQTGAYPMPIPSTPDGGLDLTPRGNVFQRLTLGPNTMLGAGLTAMDRYELTLGGGTLVGLRIRY
jgi:hypothetical protein